MRKICKAKIKAIHKDLEEVQYEIGIMEEQFLRNSFYNGNIFEGYEYFLESCELDKQIQDVIVPFQSRFLSLSSTTSPVVIHKALIKQQQKGTEIFNARRRQTRQRFQQVKKARQIKKKGQQKVIEEEQPYRYWPVPNNYQRDGSFNENHGMIKQAFKEYRSQDDQSRTLSFQSHFHSKSTEGFQEIMVKPSQKKILQRRRARSLITKQNRNKKTKKTRSKAKTQVLLPQKEPQIQINVASQIKYEEQEPQNSIINQEDGKVESQNEGRLEGEEGRLAWFLREICEL